MLRFGDTSTLVSGPVGSELRPSPRRWPPEDDQEPRGRLLLRDKGAAQTHRVAAGESVPAVAESCGTSRKTITAHYHEDLGDDFERPYPRFEEQLARAQIEITRTWTPRAPATEMLRCEAGDHDWERPKQPGTKPRSCPEHRRTRARVIALAPRPGAIGASEPCLEAG